MPRSSSTKSTVKSTPSAAPPAQPWEQAAWNYETAIAEIEAVIQAIEAEPLDLAQVFEQFERAATRLQECEQFLAHYQQQFDVLVETLGPTSAPNSPLLHETEADEEF